MSKVVILDCVISPFCMRVKIALAEKGIEFESREEKELSTNKSELLLSSNPIYKKVPVLIHDDKPVCESLIILQYIDETWPSSFPLLPKCPYERSVARFWADFIDKKVFDSANMIWRTKGEEQEVAKKEFIEFLKVLEGALGEKSFFGGDSYGFVDIAAITHTSWFYAIELFGGFKVEHECPKFGAWMKRCHEKESIAKAIPDPTIVYEFVCKLRKMQGME